MEPFLTNGQLFRQLGGDRFFLLQTASCLGSQHVGPSTCQAGYGTVFDEEAAPEATWFGADVFFASDSFMLARQATELFLTKRQLLRQHGLGQMSSLLQTASCLPGRLRNRF